MKQKPLLIKIYRDGNQWCALIGQDLQNGYAGFGDTIVGAIRGLCNLIEKEENVHYTMATLVGVEDEKS